MSRLIWMLGAILCCAFPTQAQQSRIWDSNANAWLMYFGDHPVSDRWGAHLEAQFRRHDAGVTPQQLLLRPAVNFRASDAVTLTAGYAFVNTHRYGDFPAAARFPEHRIFEQATVQHGVGKFGLQHRYRLEQRYIGQTTPGADGPQLQNWRYENRFRYMLRGVIPFSRDSKWYLAGYEEFFVNFGGNVAANVFDQNRIYGALGRRMGKPGNLEIGYLNQIIQQRNGRIFEANHTLQIAWFSKAPFR